MPGMAPRRCASSASATTEVRRRTRFAGRTGVLVNRFKEERGGIFVLSAVMIPVFLLLTALVVDAGDWYAHKRQLQNRADAAAFAAGVEYAKNWKACVQNGDLTLKASTALKIADAARTYSAD